MTRSTSAEPSTPDAHLAVQLTNCVRLPGESETTLVVSVENRGPYAAYEVQASVVETPFSDYTLESWRSPNRLLGKLSSGERQILEFTVLPKNTHDPYIDVTFQITFEQHWEQRQIRPCVRVTLAPDVKASLCSQNPYITGEPLDPRNSATMFFGRREVLHSIVQNLMGKFEQNIFVLHGQRRIGKTSLLLQLRYDRLKPPFYPVFVDMQGLPDFGTYNFLYWLSRAIVETLTEFGLHIEVPPRQFLLEAGFGGFSEFLSGVGTELHGGRLVLMLDEFEELEKRVQDGKLDSDIFSFIRSQMQHRRWLIFVFAGTHKLEELSKEYFNIFFNTAIYKEISYLTDNEAEQLIRQPVAPAITYEDRAVRRIKEATMLHPYFIQLICYHLVERVNREGRAQINFQDVDRVMAEITEGDVGHLDYLWRQSSPEEQAVLLAIAELQRTVPRVKNFPVEDIRRQIETNGDKLSRETFWRAVESLKARDLLRHNAENRAYGITFELLARWIREKHPRGS